MYMIVQATFLFCRYVFASIVIITLQADGFKTHYSHYCNNYPKYVFTNLHKCVHIQYYKSRKHGTMHNKYSVAAVTVMLLYITLV